MRFDSPPSIILALFALLLLPGSLSALAGNDIESMRAWQKRVQRSAAIGDQTVVAIGSTRREPIGSGVIVSPDGIVLTASHVTAELGRDLVVYLPSGKRLPARALGREETRDAAMIKIETNTRLPYARMQTEGTPQEGDWMIAIGHTSGFDPERPAPVRVGRVIQDALAKTAGGFLYTDCTLAGGDSGGGLFNLNGQLVGIHSQIGQTLFENMHIPMEAFRTHWDGLKAGRITREERPLIHLAPRGAEADWDQLDPMIEELMSLFPDGEAPRFMMLPLRPGTGAPRTAKNFEDLLTVVKPVVARASASTLSLYDAKDTTRPLALGTIVRPDGHVLTKASEVVTRRLKARLSNGRMVDASIVGTLSSVDLALVKLDANGLPAARFSELEAPVGSFLAAPGPDGRPMAIGVKSVDARRVDRKQYGFLGVMIEDQANGGVRVTEVIEGSPAAESGIKVGDIIRKVDRQNILSSDDLIRTIGDLLPGAPVQVRLIRDGRDRLQQVRLANRADSDITELLLHISEFMGGDLSSHRSNYPSVIQHDLALAPEQCGGPLVDLEGRVVGITIARAGRTKSYAIPGRVLVDLLSNQSIWK